MVEVEPPLEVGALYLLRIHPVINAHCSVLRPRQMLGILLIQMCPSGWLVSTSFSAKETQERFIDPPFIYFIASGGIFFPFMGGLLLLKAAATCRSRSAPG